MDNSQMNKNRENIEGLNWDFYIIISSANIDLIKNFIINNNFITT